MSNELDKLADTLRCLTALERDRLRDRFDVSELLEPDAEVTRVEMEISDAEGRLERMERRIGTAQAQLSALSEQIEHRTEILQALVRASTPAKPKSRVKTDT